MAAPMRPLPANWTWTTLKELGEVVTGTTPPKSESGNYGGNTPFIKPPDLVNKAIGTASEYLSQRGRNLARLVPANSVLVSCIGILGKTGLTTKESALNQQLNAVVCYPFVEPRYLFYYCQSSFVKEWLESQSSATTVTIINKGKFQQLPVPLPSFADQQQIVDIIETQFTRLDAAEAAMKRVQANLRRYRAAVLKAACEGRLVPTEAQLAQAEGRTYEPAAALLQRILAERREKWHAEHPGKKYKEPAGPDVSTLPELPEGWCWASAEQLCHFITKGTTPGADKLYSNSGDVPFIKVYNLTFTGQLDFSINPTYVSKKTHTGELARSIVVPGDVLLNIVGPPLGKVSIVPDIFPEWNINQAIARFRTMAPMNNRYLSICLQSEPILNWATTRAKATAGQFNLTLEICRELPIPLPPVDEQVRIASEVEARLSAAAHSERGLHLNFARSDRLRQSILQRAFSGQLVTLYSESKPSDVLATAGVTPSIQQQLSFF